MNKKKKKKPLSACFSLEMSREFVYLPILPSVVSKVQHEIVSRFEHFAVTFPSDTVFYANDSNVSEVTHKEPKQWRRKKGKTKIDASRLSVFPRYINFNTSTQREGDR